MPRKNRNDNRKPSNPSQPPGGDGDPRSMQALLDKFAEWMAMKNYSATTIANRRRFLGVFIEWAAERGLTRPGDITKPILERYQRHLYYRRKRDGEPLSFQSQHTHLTPVRAWFKWLARQNHILYNPASELELPKLEQRLPKFVLTAPEAEQVLNLPDPTQPLGVRDRAIMETFYSTGIRYVQEMLPDNKNIAILTDRLEWMPTVMSDFMRFVNSKDQDKVKASLASLLIFGRLP